MNQIFNNRNFNIYKDLKEKNFFSIKYDNKYELIINYLKTKNYDISDKKNDGDESDENDDNQDISSIFLSNINNIQTLKQKLENNMYMLSYNDIEKLLLSLGNQLTYLERNNYTFPFFDIENIIIINDNFYLYLADIDLLKIKNNNNIEILFPYKKTIFFSPNLLSLTEIPSYVPSNSWIYSLGVLATFCLTNNSDLFNKDISHFENLLQNIQNTKVYYCIKRCIRENDFLFI